MTIQAIVYSVATGRVRRVIDPNAIVPNVIAFLAQAKAGAGEAVMVYNKQGSGADTLAAWQSAVTTLTGKTPANDRYCIIDANNNIIGSLIADPSCGDAVPNCTLVAHATADQTWTFTPPNIFVAPATLPKPV